MFFLSLFLGVVLCGCGYQLEGRPANFPASWQTIYVSVWENPTSDIRFGEIMAEALRERIELAGDLKIASRDEADLILKGRVVSIQVGGLSYDEYTQTLERRVSVRAQAELLDREGHVIWRNSNIYRYEDYPVVKEIAGEEVDPGRKIALEKITRDLAEIIYHQIISA
ncbi:MAG: LptE family protein, partial [Thermodesulfobacteria bacterium]|nr:LptE family protein [Thermodesulfobacteriota bacterium]